MTIFIFLVGLAIGSFLNVVINRLEKEENIVSKRSYCPHCQAKLKWFELIPVFSFIIQKGLCRTCKNRISIQYPLVEIATGLLFFLVYSYFSDQNWPVISYWLFVISVLIVIFVYDFKYYLIPDKIIYPAILVSLGFWIWNLFRISDLGFRILENAQELGLSLLGALFFLLLVLISKEEWMGMGDVKLGVLMGLVLGWPNILAALYVGFLTGALVGLILILLKKADFKSHLPFGPFLVLGTFIAIFWGNQLIDWYWNLNFFEPFF